MSELENDPHTGRLTTGHDWNGIKELDSPIPRMVWFFLVLTTIIAIIMWVLFPAWPLGKDYTKGVLHSNQHKDLEASLERGETVRATWSAKFENQTIETLQLDPSAMVLVRANGHRLFQDNCAMCHGNDAKGARGFPDLTDDQWLWGGSPEAIMQTLRHGINANSDETRNSTMMAYGRDRMLSATQQRQVVSYVQSLSAQSSDAHAVTSFFDEVHAGSEIFAVQCSSCHGRDGKGMQTTGAPNLTDDDWLYGGSRADIEATLYNGRKGVMPHWGQRLSEVDRKMLTMYILDMRVREAK